jgi:hypothetical protein
VANRQAEEAEQNAQIADLQYQQEQAAYAPAPAQVAAAPAQGGTDDKYEALKQLGELHEQGILTDEEFAIEKQKVLQGM